MFNYYYNHFETNLKNKYTKLNIKSIKKGIYLEYIF